jgi:hypothetical protein
MLTLQYYQTLFIEVHSVAPYRIPIWNPSRSKIMLNENYSFIKQIKALKIVAINGPFKQI